MSDSIRITEMIQVTGPSDIVNGPDWLRQQIGATYAGFVMAGGSSYDYGNWACLMSNGTVAIYTNAFIQMIAESKEAFVKAGLWSSDDVGDSSLWFHRFITAFKEGTPLIYVKPDLDAGDDGCDIVVLERTPRRDEMTGDIDAARTWVIIANEYVSGQTVDGVRLSFLIEKLKDLGIKYKLGARGPEQL